MSSHSQPVHFWPALYYDSALNYVTASNVLHYRCVGLVFTTVLYIPKKPGMRNFIYGCIHVHIYMHKRKHIHLSLSIDLHRIMEKNKWQSWENLLKSKSALQILWITNAWGVWETAGKCSLHVYWLVLIKKNGTRSQVVVVIGIQSKTLSKHTSKM